MGTVQAKAGAWNGTMTFMYTEGQMVSSLKKHLITSIDETFVYDCQGNEVMHFTENTQRGKHNNVEIEDGKENSLGTTRLYYNFVGIHAPNGRALGVGSPRTMACWAPAHWLVDFSPLFSGPVSAATQL